jgi:hypothetical protein
MMGWIQTEGVAITLLNLDATTLSAGFETVVADARDLSRYGNYQFDVVFSNSLIEHVGNSGDQQRMAGEVMRVGRCYFIQTPNRYFPIEPHFLLPGFQFLPLWAKLQILQRFNVHTMAMPSRAAQLEEARTIRLLSARDMRRLFPRCLLYRERFMGWTKSLTAIGGGWLFGPDDVLEQGRTSISSLLTVLPASLGVSKRSRSPQSHFAPISTFESPMRQV